LDTKLEARLRRLVDKDEIADVMARYCRGVDRCDVDLIASAFHPDAVDEHSYRVLGGTEVGPFLVERMRTTFKASLHSLLQSRIEIDGDTATGETYYVAWLLSEQDGKERIDQAEGRYVDRFERRRGEWRIAHRVVLPEMSASFDRPNQHLVKHLADKPERSAADISYRTLG
jgi:ketosteroid isomerase-like protein